MLKINALRRACITAPAFAISKLSLYPTFGIKNFSGKAPSEHGKPAASSETRYYPFALTSSMEPLPHDLSVGALSPGAHAAFLYSSAAEQADTLQTFVGAALHANHRVVYVGDGEYGEHALKAYGEGGVRAIASGQFMIENSANTYMAGGRFDAKRMLAHYNAALADALSEGYSGLRVAADMGWAAAGLDGKEQLVAYERTLDRALDGRPAVVLCQYDRRLFDEDILAALAAAHMHSAHPDPLHHSRQLRVMRTYEPHGVQISGEIDVLNRRAFRDALLHVVSLSDGHIVIDLRGVKYLDAGAIGAIVNAAQHANRSSIEIRVPVNLRRFFEALEPTLPPTVHADVAE